MKNSKVFGIVGGSVQEPKVQYLKDPISFPKEMAALPDSVSATEIFRFVSPCAQKKCQHFDDGICNVAKRMVERILPINDVSSTKACAIRTSCRWWKQEGWEACNRCPLIVTDSYNPDSITASIFGDV